MNWRPVSRCVIFQFVVLRLSVLRILPALSVAIHRETVGHDSPVISWPGSICDVTQSELSETGFVEVRKLPLLSPMTQSCEDGQEREVSWLPTSTSTECQVGDVVSAF